MFKQDFALIVNILGATFSEAFYGLKRVEGDKQNLSSGSVTKSIASEEVLPFLLNGLNNVSEKLLFDSFSGKKKVRNWFNCLKVYINLF